MNAIKPGSAGADSGGPVVERPRLNLKPRSMPAEQSDETAERARFDILPFSNLSFIVLQLRFWAFRVLACVRSLSGIASYQVMLVLFVLSIFCSLDYLNYIYLD